MINDVIATCQERPKIGLGLLGIVILLVVGAIIWNQSCIESRPSINDYLTQDQYWMAKKTPSNDRRCFLNYEFKLITCV